MVNSICKPSSRLRESYPVTFEGGGGRGGTVPLLLVFTHCDRVCVRECVVACAHARTGDGVCRPDHRAHSCFRIKYTNLKPIARPRCIKMYYYYYYFVFLLHQLFGLCYNIIHTTRVLKNKNVEYNNNKRRVSAFE